MMEVGQRVRLIHDPNRIGVFLGKTRGGGDGGGVRRLQIQFPQGHQYVPEDQLEVLPEQPEDPIGLLEKGKLGHAFDLRRTLTHARLTGRLANIIYSMDTTGTDFYAYQFKPVVKLLNSASRGILIADEVGLGKTIEAGLIWTELRSREDFRRLLVLCPAVLRDKWRRELRSRFGVDAEILDAGGTLERLQSAAEEGPTARFAIVASLQGLRPSKGWDEEDLEGGASVQLARLLEAREQEEPLIDLAIIDEAHYMRNPSTMTATLGRLVRRCSSYVALLSATPVHLKSSDLYQLLNLVDEDTFDRQQSFEDILQANGPLVSARERVLTGKADPEEMTELLTLAAKHPLLSGSRQLEGLLEKGFTVEELRDAGHVSHLAHRLERVNLLGQSVNRMRKRDVDEWRVIRRAKAEEVPTTPVEREFYETVTAVVRAYCMRRAVHEGFLLVTPQRQMSSSMPAALRSWQRDGGTDSGLIFEDLGVGDEAINHAPEERPLVQELVSRAHELGDFDELRANDSKYARLRSELERFFAERPVEKVVLFSYFRATLHYLHERLLEDGIQSVVMHGGTEDKDQIVSEFREAREPMVLLSSEVGSEGIDLQFSSLVINYDLPWNPMRVEQRIGRLDRLGQKSQVIDIWNLFYAETIDSRIYRRLFERLRIFEEALGSLEPILGDKIQELTSELFRGQLTAEEEEERIEQTRLALAHIKRHEEELEEEAAHLVAYGDYILNEIKAARDLNRSINAGDIRTYVIDFLRMNYAGCDFRQVGDDPAVYEIALSTEAKHDLAGFLRGAKLEGSTQLTRNDARALRCRFENTVAPPLRRQEEIISQFHPLVRFVASRVEEAEEARRPAVSSAVVRSELPRALPAGVYGFSVQRWQVSGVRDVERLHYAALRLDAPDGLLADDDAEQLVTTAAVAGKDWLAAGSALDLERAAALVSEHCTGGSDSAFQAFRDELEAENQDRADVQERNLERHHETQRVKLEGVLEGHRRHGRTGLVRATEGRIRALEERVKRRRLEIRERRNLRYGNEDICVGVVQVSDR